MYLLFFFQAEDGIRDSGVTGVQTCALPIWAPLVCGARLVVIDRDTLLTPRALARRLRAAGVTVQFLTTALFTRVVEEVPDAFAGLDTLIIGGDRKSTRLNSSHANILYAVFCL